MGGIGSIRKACIVARVVGWVDKVRLLLSVPGAEIARSRAPVDARLFIVCRVVLLLPRGPSFFDMTFLLSKPNCRRASVGVEQRSTLQARRRCVSFVPVLSLVSSRRSCDGQRCCSCPPSSPSYACLEDWKWRSTPE